MFPACKADLGPQEVLGLLDLPAALLGRIVLDLGAHGRSAYASCRRLRAAWRGAMGLPGVAARYLFGRYGRRGAVPAMFGLCSGIVQLRAEVTAEEQQDPQQQELSEDGRRAQQLGREGEAALSLLSALYSAGAQQEANVLLMAARTGHTEVAREVLASGLDGLNPRQALLLALEHATHVGRARELVQLLEGAGAVAAAGERQNALTRNVNRDVGCVLLMEMGITLNEGTDSLLSSAPASGNNVLAHRLLDAGARLDPDYDLPKAATMDDEALFGRLMLMDQSPWRFDVLRAVVQHNRRGMLRHLLAAGGPEYTKKQLGEALKVACMYYSDGCAEELLQAGVDLTTLTHALETAVSKGFTGIVRLLVSSGQYPQKELGGALAHACCKLKCQPEMVQHVLAAGADPVLGLCAAVEGGHADLLRLLLATGRCAPESVQMRYALAAACRSGHTEMVRLLLGAGADPRVALEVAERNGDARLLELLMEAG